MYLVYGAKELNYLKKKDKRLGLVIEGLGFIERQADADVFTALVHHIVGQQISRKAQETVFKRLQDLVPTLVAESIAFLTIEELQKCGLSLRKATYIHELAERIVRGELDLSLLDTLSDEECIKYLTTIKGVGRWTAEMILLFCLKRPDIFSYDDIIIRRGLRMLYHHRLLTRDLFLKYKKRYSPYGSIASLYIWAIGNGDAKQIVRECEQFI